MSLTNSCFFFYKNFTTDTLHCALIIGCSNFLHAYIMVMEGSNIPACEISYQKLLTIFLFDKQKLMTLVLNYFHFILFLIVLLKL